MHYAQEIQDLCTTCNNGSDCLSRATLIRPVIHCEEFACESHESRKPQFVLVGKTSASAGNNPYRGLCSNCEDRNACLPERTAAGIQYCEEYR